MAKNKPVYAFEEADSKKRMLLGGKGAGLSEMTRLKLPVPPGFTITTEVCNKYYDNNRKLPKDVMPAVMKNIAKMEKKDARENTLLLVLLIKKALIKDCALYVGEADQINFYFLFLLFPLVMYYLLLFVNSVEKSCFISNLKIEKLTEGDWLAEDVFVDNKKIMEKKTSRTNSKL